MFKAVADVLSQGEPCALGVLELSSIPRGVGVADALLKRAQVELLASRPVSGGGFLIMIRGGISEMEESLDAGAVHAGEKLVDSVNIPFLHEPLWEWIPEPKNESWNDSKLAALVVETRSVSSALRGADLACKATDVRVRDMRLAVGIAGKAFFTLTGHHSDIQAAADDILAELGDCLLDHEVIASPADDIVGRLII